MMNKEYTKEIILTERHIAYSIAYALAVDEEIWNILTEEDLK